MTDARTRLPVEGSLPSLDGATGWLNSPPLTPEALRGRVVLIDFWTYTCINWLRTAPYIRAWAQRYADQGLVVIGVHTPEFQVEHDRANVRRSVTDMQLPYPVAVDDDYGVWTAFGNHYWPAVYVADAEGRIRHHQFGEGGYERIEEVLQQLLDEAGTGDGDETPTPITAVGVEAAADWADLGSPENYVGYGRTTGFASPGGVVPDQPHDYAVPDRLRLNSWALAGEWTVGAEEVVLDRAPGRISCRFHARDVHLVLGPAPGGRPVRFRVLLDGRPPEDAAGADVAADGTGEVGTSRLYQLVRQARPIVDRTVEIEFLDPGVSALVFTFG
jgi:thiol-disulfide isomerase/thioredoxin